jgi:chromosome segregation protein
MFLEKLEIQGFKSFATKNILVFPGMLDKTKRGITAVVGPNGSGKSNTADAVRWALGEQSMKTLRGKKSEDVIFSGSDKKGKLGMAEVSLYLNNEDRKAPIDYAQMILTRRLYRNGESEYLINNSRVRLFDIQIMLAKANFGQKTYSVIGQGMVEGFLNTSLAERKEFFDEATGVKQYQIKRDDSLNKLRSSFDNLIQAEMLINEIEPRLKSLTRQVTKLKKRGELEAELKIIQTDYYSYLWHDINDKFSHYNNSFLELEKEKFAKEKKLSVIERELEQIKLESDKENKYSHWQKELTTIQSHKDNLTKRLAKLEAQMEIKLEANGQFDLSYLRQKKDEINLELKEIMEEISDMEKHIATDKEHGRELLETREKNEIKIKELNQKLINLGRQADTNDVKLINSHLKTTKEIAAAMAISEKYTAGDENEADSWGRLHNALAEFNNIKEDLIIKINENNLRISARSERTKLLREKVSQLQKEFEAIENKLKQKSGQAGIAEAEAEQADLKIELEKADIKIKAIQDNINQISVEDEKKRNRLFALQNELVLMQSEINNVSNSLNELKINSTRFETKLEDLEIEIRQELGGLADIKKTKPNGDFNIDEAKEKISQLKRQLDLIGGIDPAIEKEYDETKERYDFLFGQVSDLKEAIGSLEKIIKELDITIKERFDKEFKIISENFEKYFKVLFNGGNAKVIKVMADESSFTEASEDKESGGEAGSEDKNIEATNKEVKIEDVVLKRIKFLQKHNATGLAGIEIQATPPGKKIKSIAMLSGGERALTAIAMICAIISANPSPFVVLDEVDASLDEANSERLAKILDELSHKTQFIVITHNRASMRKANILYGVTMGDDGVSKLLSIKLDEVKVE